MPRKHIIQIDYVSYVVESATAATQLITQLAKLKRVARRTEAEDPNDWYYEEEAGAREIEVSLKLNQPFREARKITPKAGKPLALPKPKKGSILCICEHSYVAPRETCTHCGRPFSESHNRTHGDTVSPKPQLRLL